MTWTSSYNAAYTKPLVRQLMAGQADGLFIDSLGTAPIDLDYTLSQAINPHTGNRRGVAGGRGKDGPGREGGPAPGQAALHEWAGPRIALLERAGSAAICM